MGTSDGSVVGATKIVDHGSDASRWTMVIVAEGYTATQLTQFHTDAQNFVNTLFATAPFDTLGPAINVYRLDVSSTDSGADDPTACGGSGATAATYFDARFCNSGIRRLLQVNNGSIITTVSGQVPPWDMILVLVNTTVYGGSGGSIATASLAPSAIEIAIHEMGHTAFGLADEYEYWAGCGSGESGHNNHPASEPSEPNVTIDSNRATIKWGDLIAATTAMPTTQNANCAQCDSQASPVATGIVGAFEGAHYYHCDAYRPEFNCRMRALGFPFCAVCRRRITQTLTPFLPHKSIWKDVKDVKIEKIEKLEKIEHKEFKLEFKEFKLEKFEIKEFEKHVFEGPKLKDAEVDPFTIDPGIMERLGRLEADLTRLTHFIEREDRPDIRRGALTNEQRNAAPDQQSSSGGADSAGERERES